MKYQRQFYEATDVSSSCFVFASAGSGKTKILVDRYIKSLFYGIKPSEILCLTFTNAAVFEMESRISKILENIYLNENNFAESYLIDVIEIQHPTSKDIEKAANLFLKFQDDLSNLKIMTIHAFCQDLLKKFPLESEISPNFEIIDENDGLKLIKESKKNVFKNIFYENENDFFKLSNLISVYSFEDFVNRIFSNSSKFMNFFEKNPNLDEYKKKLSEEFNLKNSEDFSIEQNDFIKKFLKSDNLEDLLLTKTGTIRKKLPFSENKIIHQIAEILFNNLQNQKKSKLIEKTCGFLKIAKLIFDEFQRLKQSQNVLDFNDVLHKTEYLLTKSCAKEFVLSEIGRRIKSVMIDESQDLSSIQWRLVSLFCDDIFSDPHSEKTIFVVGDIKQSIYRFQDADHKLFVKFYENCQNIFANLEKKFKTVYLNTCYRTLPKILEKVDSVFEGCAKFAFGQNSIDYKKHIPFRADSPGNFELIELKDPENSAKEIASYIKNLKILDVLILTRSRNELTENIMKELVNLGLEIAPPDRITLNNNLIVMDILALADIAIDSQNSDYSTACVLKSPYIFENPLNNNDLFEICHNRVKSVFENLEINHKDKYILLKNIKSHYQQDNLVSFFYYITKKIIIKNSKDDDHILSSFMDNVLNFTANKSENILEFIEYFRNSTIQISNQNPVSKCVRISTIHGAKGLESENVILLDFDLKPDKNKLKFIWTENDNFLIKPGKNDSFSEIDSIIENEYIEEEKELLRLLYVALTRPRDSIYIFGSPSEKTTAFNLIKNH